MSDPTGRRETTLSEGEGAENEVEVTPEMVEIGVSALLKDSGVAFGIEHFSAEEAVERVYRAMDAVRTKPN